MRRRLSKREIERALDELNTGSPRLSELELHGDAAEIAAKLLELDGVEGDDGPDSSSFGRELRHFCEAHLAGQVDNVDEWVTHRSQGDGTGGPVEARRAL